MEARPILVWGNVGGDAGYWYLGSDGKIHHVPGWNPETRQAFETLEKSLAVLERSAREVTSGVTGKLNQNGALNEKTAL